MKTMVMIGLVIVVSGCGVSVGYDYAQFGTEKGIQANGDQLNALITNGKQSPDTKSAAWDNADLRQIETTKRIGQGFLTRMFKKNEVQK